MPLQHLRSSTANKRPQPSGMSEAQIALNIEGSSPGLFFKTSAGNLVKTGPVHVGTAAPNASPASGGTTGNTIGEQWLDTTGGTYALKTWDGSVWRTDTITGAMIASGTITDANINASAEIAVSKLADGAARQLLQTDAAGTGVEWASNIDIPGTLDVTSVATFDSTITVADNLTLNAQADLRFADADSSNWVAFQAPATVGTNVTWTLPSGDGSSSQVLQTNGAGTLSWASPVAGGDTYLASGNTFTGANNFYNNTGQTFGTATSTQDGIRLQGRPGGSTSLRVTIVPGTLSSNRTLTAPDTTGTIITTGDSATVTNAMLAGSITDSKLSTITTAGKVSGTAITSGNISTSGSFATTSTMAVGQASAAANTDFDLAGTYAQTIIAVPALAIDCSSGNYFTKTIAGASTFTVTNVPTSRAYSFTLEITHTSGAITWFSGVEWPGGTAPTLTTGKTHLFMFVTDDGGTRWRASSLINYTN